MKIALITGAGGLIGSEAVEHFAGQGYKVVGVDNDLRSYFFGDEASTGSRVARLQEVVANYDHRAVDIRDFTQLEILFHHFNKDIALIVHTAAQPSHDWAAREPLTDFGVNATGTLNLLELCRLHCPEAAFLFLSTNKVYGDRPNALPLEERETRWELPQDHSAFDGIDEEMSIDQCKHSLFGASKAAADLLVQEYGRYFGMKTACFRGGCLTGPRHAGAELHGFLSYLVKCCLTGRTYRIFGYKGKQVRDNIHSRDLVAALDAFSRAPRCGEVYNLGGGRENNCSMQEAIRLCEEISGKKMKTEYVETARSGDHIWYISSLEKFQSHYPGWSQTKTLRQTLEEIVAAG